MSGGQGGTGADPRRLAGRLKRASAVLTALAFGAFWGLAAGHPVGVTASQSSGGAASIVQAVGGGAVPLQTPAAAQRRTSSSGTSTRVRSRISNGGSSAPVLSSGSS